MNIVSLIFGGLIVWRVSDLLVNQSGPLDMFVRFRAYLAQKQTRKGGLYDMLSCVACTTVIIGAVTSLAFAGGLFEWIAYTLSFSALATLIEYY